MFIKLYRDAGDYSRGIKGDTKNLSYSSYSPYSHGKRLIFAGPQTYPRILVALPRQVPV